MPIATDLEDRGIAQPPDVDVSVWRFMDFTKFVWLLEMASLYFPRADQLDDPFEGSVPERHRTERKGWYAPLRPEHAAGIAADMPMIHERSTRLTFLSCWHMGEHESSALWAEYASRDAGIAVQGTYAKLLEALAGCEHDGAAGIVQYRDYGPSGDVIYEGNTLTPFFYKRNNYEHEKEVRVALVADGDYTKQVIDYERAMRDGTPGDHTPPREILGLVVPIDVDILISRVFVSATSPGWVEDLVAAVIRRYDFEWEIVRSSLRDAPAY